MYKCPICNQILNKEINTYKCINKHSFDIGKNNYLNLNTNMRKDTGDSDLLVNARNEFLNTNNYKPLLDKLVAIINKYNPNTIIDLACGTGYYTNSLSNNAKIYGFDLAKKAIIKACRSRKDNTNYLVSSIFDLPLFDHTIDLALLIFAPLPLDEIKRVLKINGIFIEVIPNINHLVEIKEIIYPKVILNNPKVIDDQSLVLIDSYNLDYKMLLSAEELLNLYMMTPYYYKSPKGAINKLNEAAPINISANFIINVYKLIR